MGVEHILVEQIGVELEEWVFQSSEYQEEQQAIASAQKIQYVSQVQCQNGLKTVLDDMPRQCALLHYAQDSASESSERIRVK